MVCIANPELIDLKYSENRYMEKFKNGTDYFLNGISSQMKMGIRYTLNHRCKILFIM